MLVAGEVETGMIYSMEAETGVGKVAEKLTDTGKAHTSNPAACRCGRAAHSWRSVSVILSLQCVNT